VVQVRPHGRIRTLLVVASMVALVALVVVASQDAAVQPSAERSLSLAAGEEAGCTGDCANCPNAAGGAAEQECAAVDTERCIACVRCVNVSPEAFRMNPDTGKAEVIPGASAEDIARGAQACPVHAVTQ
jgi:ferredoxin